jgi:hypothetical protein
MTQDTTQVKHPSNDLANLITYKNKPYNMLKTGIFGKKCGIICG